MKRPYIASIGLTAAMVFAAVSIATANYSHGLKANPTAHPVSLCGLNKPGHSTSKPATAKQTEAKASLPANRLTAQVPIATTCYTFAGPTCPMVIAVPVGSFCTCNYPGGALAGRAY